MDFVHEQLETKVAHECDVLVIGSGTCRRNERRFHSARCKRDAKGSLRKRRKAS